MTVVLERLTRLQDGLDNAMADMWGDEYSDGFGYEGEEAEDVEIQYDDGSQTAWERYDGDLENGDWEDVEEGGDDWNSAAADLVSNADMIVDPDPVAAEDAMDVDLPPSTIEIPGIATRSVDVDVPSIPDITATSSGPSSGVRSPAEIDIAAKKVNDIPEEDEDHPWQRFVIHPQAPVDHAFYSSKVAQTTKAFMNRLNKEYRVLKSSLPGALQNLFG